MVEKHFTLDRAWPGGDNFMSAEPEDLRVLAAKAVKAPAPNDRANCLAALKETNPPYWGDPHKKPLPGENPALIRRWAIAARDLTKGQELRPNDVVFQRTALPPTPLLGPEEPFPLVRVTKDLAKGTPVAWLDLDLIRR
jgi:sialic acid synthase SpsE